MNLILWLVYMAGRESQGAAMEFSIRTALEADIPAMHRLRCSVRENRLSDPGRVTAASYMPYIQSGSAWVADAQSGILGFAALDLAAPSLWALFVASEAEGLGVGRDLHDAVLDRARAEGIRRLWLNTSPGTRAEHFYRAAGWEEAGLTPDGELRLEKSI